MLVMRVKQPYIAHELIPTCFLLPKPILKLSPRRIMTPRVLQILMEKLEPLRRHLPHLQIPLRTDFMKLNHRVHPKRLGQVQKRKLQVRNLPILDLKSCVPRVIPKLRAETWGKHDPHVNQRDPILDFFLVPKIQHVNMSPGN